MDSLVCSAALFGKHPSSSEYLFLGNDSPFMCSIKLWVEKGYESFLQGRKSKKSNSMYHFCFIKQNSNTFICGSVKMSKDSQKREYPLVIAVEASSLLPFDNTQQIVEYTKSINKKILKIFQKELQLMDLKQELLHLSTNDKLKKQENNFISSIFMNEDFSEVELFSRPLEISDFTRIMR